MFGSAVSNRAVGRATTSTSAGLTETTRVRHVITEDCTGIALLFAGWFNGETAMSQDATIKAAVEITVNGSQVIHPITFDGLRTRTLTAGAVVRSDSIGLNLKKGDVVWVRALRTIASGTYGCNLALLGATSGEGLVASDAVDSGTVTATADDITAAFSAHAIVSAGSPGLSVSFIGDSISNGQNETVRELGGYMLRSLPSGVGVIRANNGGSTVSTFIGNTTNASGGRRRLPLALSARYAWIEYGVNDVNGGDSLDTIQANLLRLWQQLANAGVKVYQSTLTPWSSSTDAWATTTGQTPFTGGKHEVRIALNDWIRTKPAPLSGYFEVADLAETTRNSGIWRLTPTNAAPTTDGIHANTEMHIYLAAGIASAVATAFI